MYIILWTGSRSAARRAHTPWPHLEPLVRDDRATTVCSLRMWTIYSQFQITLLYYNNIRVYSRANRLRGIYLKSVYTCRTVLIGDARKRYILFRNTVYKLNIILIFNLCLILYRSRSYVNYIHLYTIIIYYCLL